MTEKLYDRDSMIRVFSARVVGCEKVGKRYTVLLDQTAFFPEGGGQSADTGGIGPARVLDVQEEKGLIRHYTDSPLPVGVALTCMLDWEQRFRRMQNHSGEHVISGIIHREHGLENVGFHMGAACMTMDYSGELSWEELMRVETLANEAVRDDLPVRAWYPEPAELASMSYRSKLELTEQVRIVTIPGIDCCACCAPHVARTGQIGAVKILTAERHRGGTRITALCGMEAMEDYRRRQESVAALSVLLSAPREEVVPAVERVLSERERFRERIAQLSMELVRVRAENTPYTEGNLCIFDGLLDEIALRELVNLLMDRCGGVAAAFSGSDETGYRYIIGSRHVDLRSCARAINAGIGGRGGGSVSMIQGRAEKSKAEIQNYWERTLFRHL